MWSPPVPCTAALLVLSVALLTIRLLSSSIATYVHIIQVPKILLQCYKQLLQ